MGEIELTPEQQAEAERIEDIILGFYHAAEHLREFAKVRLPRDPRF